MKNPVATAVMSLGLLLVPRLTAQQESKEPNAKVSPLDAKISDFALDNRSILIGIEMLNRQSESISFGFEAILTVKHTDPPRAYPKITVQLTSPSTRQVLDALCAADPRYTWSLDGSTVNVFPRSTVTDLKYLLNRKLAEFRLDGITQIQEGLFAIADQLPGPLEQIAHAQIGGDATYPSKPWSVTFKNLTVRQAVNRLVEHMGTSSAWILGGSDEFRHFSFYSDGLHVSPPDESSDR
jgi:hypothetical protein